MATKSKLIFIGELEDLPENFRWRIDWISDPYKAGGHHEQHMVDVWLSPLLKDYSGLITSPLATDLFAQRKRSLGVGCLPAIYRGALFRKGKRLPLRLESTNRVKLKVRPSTGQFITLGEPLCRSFAGPDPIYAVYPTEYSVGGSAWKASAEKSQVLCLADWGETDPFYAMISPNEVARFFLCTTSLMAKSLFQAGWQNLIWPKLCDKSDMPRSIVVGTETVLGLKHRDAIQLGCFLTNEKMAQTVTGLYQGLQEANRNKPPKPMECHFPFDEDIEVDAEVIEIPTGTSLKRRYFVTRLISCNRPRPFDICYVHPKLHPGQGDNAGSQDLKEINVGKGQSDSTEQSSSPTSSSPTESSLQEIEKNNKVTDEDGHPSAAVDDIHIEDPEDRFAEWNTIPAVLTKKAVQEYRSKKGGKAIPFDATGMSTGNPRGSRTVVLATIDTDSQAESDDPNIKLLHEAAGLLSERSYIVEVLPSVRLSYFEEGSKKRRPTWGKIAISAEENGGKSFRSRLLGAIEITLAVEKCVVVEIERRNGVPYGLAAFYIPLDADTDQLLEVVARTMVERKGIPLWDKESETFSLQTHQVSGRRGIHTEVNSAEQLANKIERHFLR